MNLTKSIYNNSFFYFLSIVLFAIWGFWVTYFTRPPETVNSLEHIHGAAMFGWCLMLIVQSFLIRTQRRTVHRVIGKLSYLLAPLIVISTIMLAKYKLNVRGLTDEGLYVLALQVFTLILFVVSYVQAMRNRKQPDVHARYMICTALTLLDPIFARVLLVNFLHVPLESGVIQYLTYGFIDLILLVLAFLDWNKSQRRDVFSPMLLLFIAMQAPVFFVLDMPAWTAFAEWFM